MLTDNQMQYANIGIVSILSIGAICSMWMVGSLVFSIRKNRRTKQPLIVYKILLMIAISDVVATVSAVAKRMVIHKCIKSSIPKVLWNVLSNSYYLAMFMTLLWEAALILQVYLLTRQTRTKRLGFKWLNFIIAIPLVARIVAYEYIFTMIFIELIVYFFIGIFFLVISVQFVYQLYYGQLSDRLRGVIKRVSLFPMIYFVCFLPKAIMNLDRYISEVFLRKPFRYKTNDEVTLIVEVLRYTFFILNCLIYGSFLRSSSPQNVTNEKGVSSLSQHHPAAIDPSHVEIDTANILGQGAMGTVYKGVYRRTDVAVKCLPLYGYADTRSVKKNRAFIVEAETLNRLFHPNIVYFMGSYVKNGHGYIVCEYCESESLADVLAYFQKNQTRKMSWQWKLKIALDTACGLNYLHQMNVVHRDLKSPNVLLSGYTAKVADFGTAKLLATLSKLPEEKTTKGCPRDIESNAYFAGLHTTQVGTISWTAPEILLNYTSGIGAYNTAADVYSFGILLWEIATQELPFPALKFNFDVQQQVLQGKRPEIPPRSESAAPAEYIHLMKTCWSESPTRRPTMDIVVAKLKVLANHSI